MDERKTYFADVILPVPVAGKFTYRVPFEMNGDIRVGQLVVVQFGAVKMLSGIVADITEKVPNVKTIKYIESILTPLPIVNAIQLRLWNWMASYYICGIGDVMQSAMPSAMRLSSETKISLTPDYDIDNQALDDNEFLIAEALQIKSKITISEASKIIGFKKIMPFIKKMIDKGIIVMEEELKGRYKARYERFIGIAPTFREEDKMREMMDELSKRAYKQLEILMSFFAIGGDFDKEVLLSDVLKKADATSATAQTLVNKGILTICERRVSRLKKFEATTGADSITLTPAQEKAINSIREYFGEKKNVLLHGVTSSGKTEIYVKLIQEAIDKGRQVLYLLPEIALTEQLINRLRRYFGDKVGVYHSRYGDNERVEVWNQVMEFETTKNPKYQIVLGSRSALFLPYSNLGLVIIDEEHDGSFKQSDPSPRYNGRDTAIVLAKMHDANVLLGSATPSFETYFNAMTGRFAIVRLTERYGGIGLPEVIIDDLRIETRRKTMSNFFGSTLIDSVKEALKNKKQAIIFQNRRGFSVRIECMACKQTPQCVNCDVSMTYHKKENILRCHYCGYTMEVPAECPHCHSTDLKFVGFGTERVEEDLQTVMPEARIDRLDLDATRSKNAYQLIFDKFQNKETDILVGTQMITKGLDFDNVKVVGILNADNMLSYPDFRAYERGFQLMAQVSGRAGRKGERGKVIIQTYQPTHPVILNVINNDYEKLYAEQMTVRKQYKYPPFYRLIVLKLKHQNENTLNAAAEVLASLLRPVFGGGNTVDLLGPEAPSIPRIQNLYIKNIIIKFKRELNAAAIKQALSERIDVFRHLSEYRSVQLQIDVDP